MKTGGGFGMTHRLLQFVLFDSRRGFLPGLSAGAGLAVGWAWHHGSPASCFMMIVGVYATLGVF
jgi:hypothetical protein